MKKNKRESRRTIKGDIQKVVILLVTISLIAVGILSCVLNYFSTLSIAENALQKTASVAAEQIQYRMTSLINIVEVMGTMKSLSDDNVSLEEKRSILDELMDTYALRSSRIIDTKGISIFDPDKDLSERDYFKIAVKGKTNISDPIFSSTDGELIITIAAPVWKGGIRNTEVVGVVMVTLDAKGLSELVTEIKVTEHGGSYLINSQGTIIAHPYFENVTEGVNNIVQSESDKSLLDEAKIEKDMIAGNTDIAYQTYGKQKQIIGYAPVNGLNGWSLGVYSPISDFMDGTIQSIVATLLLLLITLLVSIFIIRYLALGIGNPIKVCAERISLLSEGDIKTSFPNIESKNETGILVQATRAHLGSLNVILMDLGHCLGEISNGNFAVASEHQDRYVGDFEAISVSVSEICNKLTQTLSQINHVAEQVSISATQVSQGATALSTGTVEQSNSVEELSETIKETVSQIKKNAQNADAAKKQSDASGKDVEESNLQMQQLIVAMGEISNKSNEIGEIIKTIDDIASQTNLLALNAAIEAARAGDAGKGFAVVAEEVRELAGKSVEAAKGISLLINETIHSVENGTQIANNTANSMSTVVEGVRSVISLVDEITTATGEQSDAVSQIANGVEQIASVVQSNTITAAESASASEKLSDQSQILKDLVNRFHLK